MSGNLFFVWILAGFATYRIAKMIATEEGPGAVFQKLRYHLGGYDLAENGEPHTLWGRMITCPHCVGVYVALFFVMLVLINTWATLAIIAWLGVAGLQSFLQELHSP